AMRSGPTTPASRRRSDAGHPRPRRTTAMAKMVEDLDKWVKDRGAELDELAKKYAKPLTFESDDDKAKASSPNDAVNAGSILTGISNNVSMINSSLLSDDIQREAYWSGPAATVFGQTIAAYRDYLTQLAQVADTFSNVTTFGVAQRHQQALRNHETA